jgi:hypothetical protein
LTAKQGKKWSASFHFGFEAAERRVSHKRKRKKEKKIKEKFTLFLKL